MENTKFEETHETNQFVSSSTADDHIVNSVIKRENAILNWLKRIFNLKVLATIAGVVAAVAAVIAIWPRNNLEKFIEEIDKKAAIIEGSFHPNAIRIDSYSTPDFQLVKDFQTSVLKFVSSWKSIKSMEPVSDYKSAGSKELGNIVTSQLLTINVFVKQAGDIYLNIKNIQEYSIANSIDAYMPKADKMASLKEKAAKRTEVTNTTIKTVIEKIKELNNKYGKEMDNIPRDEFVKAVEQCDKIIMNEDELDYINKLLSYCIELNTSYTDYLRGIQ